MPVAKNDIILVQPYNAGNTVSINVGTANSTLSSTTGYLVYDITNDADAITFSVGRDGGIVGVLVMEVDDDVATADYTINYKYGGTTVKTVSESGIAVGTIIPVLTTFWAEEVKYVTDSGQASSLTVAAGGSSLDITVHVAETFSYTVNAVDGLDNILKTITSGSVTEGDAVATFPFPQYILKGTTLYEGPQMPTGNNTYYKYIGYTPAADDDVLKLTYTEKAANVVFFTEAEDITGGTANSASNTDIRCSMAEGAYFSDETTVTTLQAGTYTIVAQIWGAAGTTFTLKAGDFTFTPTTTGSLLSATSDVFTLDAATALTVEGGSSGKVVDLIYVIEMPVATGTFYLKNKANNAYFAAGSNWNTKAITNNIGHTVNITANAGGKYNLDTQIFNNSSNHYLNGVWTDGAAASWNFVADGAGYYTINDGTNNLTAGAVGEELTLASGTADNAKWQLLTAAEWKAEQEARLSSATYSSGVDATFYVPAANFNRNDNTENAKWNGAPSISGESVGENNNFNAEKFTDPYATFDVYQSLTGLTPGAYKLTMQGYYRNGLDNASDANDQLAILYANDAETPLLNINAYGYADNSHASDGFTTAKSGYYVPDSQADASKAFNAGCYVNTLFFTVGDDGTLRLGVKKTAATGADKDWTVMDNFQLTYYGEQFPVTVTSAGWATLYTPYGLDFEGSGLTAYTATCDGTTVTLTEVKNVQANTGVVLKGTAKDYDIPVTTTSTTDRGELQGSATEALTYSATADYDYYMLAKKGDNAQFSKLTSGTIAAGKAYLAIAKGGGDSAPALQVVFIDANGTTGIETVTAAQQDEKSEAVYNLAGQRVSQPAKGLYIIGGKKIVIK